MSFFDDLGDICRRDVPLGPLTWFKLGGPAEFLIEPRTDSEFAEIIRHCGRSGMPMRVLGLGANVLVSDAGIRGVVVRLTSGSFVDTRFDGPTLTAGAGVGLAKLIVACVRKGLSGLEQLAGIPATIGGAIRMNCGGRYGDVSEKLVSVRVVRPDGEIVERTRTDLDFGYRGCALGDDQVLAARFELNPCDADELHIRFREIWTYKQGTQPPLGVQSAGCIFRNPDGASAGKLIDTAGCKGLRSGSAVVSDQHANFIVADSPGRAADVIALIEMVRDRVEASHGVRLEPEVQIWRDDD